MSPKPTIKGRIVFEFLKKHPEMPTMTLAKLVYKKNANIFPTVNSARQLIKYYTGQNGKAAKKRIADKSLFRPEGPKNPFKDLPKGLKHFKNLNPYKIKGNSILVISDLHVPYHDLHALTLALEYGIKHKVDTIVLLGDFVDFYGVSSFVRDPRKRKFKYELEIIRKVFTTIASAFSNCEIVYLPGNHEYRYERWMLLKAPELLDIDIFSMSHATGIDELNIKMLEPNKLISIGRLSLLHGHELKGSGVLVNPARSAFLKGYENLLIGHHHRPSHHAEKTLTGKVLSCFSIGCLSNLQPDYAPYNKYQHGFAHIQRTSAVDFIVNNKRIINGEVF